MPKYTATPIQQSEAAKQTIAKMQAAQNRHLCARQITAEIDCYPESKRRNRGADNRQNTQKGKSLPCHRADNCRNKRSTPFKTSKPHSRQSPKYTQLKIAILPQGRYLPKYTLIPSQNVETAEQTMAKIHKEENRRLASRQIIAEIDGSSHSKRRNRGADNRQNVRFSQSKRRNHRGDSCQNTRS